MLLPSGVHFLAQKKETETLMSLERRCVYLHQHNHFDEGSFTFILLFLQQLLIPFGASKKSSICFDLSIRRILLHRSVVSKSSLVFLYKEQWLQRMKATFRRPLSFFFAFCVEAFMIICLPFQREQQPFLFCIKPTRED